MTTGTETKSSLTAWERWELASFEPGAEQKSRQAEDAPVPQLNAAEVAQLRETARTEGHTEGHESGYTAGHAEGLIAGEAEAAEHGREEAERLAGIISTLETQITELNQIVADDLVALSIVLARQVIRQTIAMQPESVLSVVREALSQMPLQHASIHLNPEDASLARSRAGDQLAHAGHRIHEDPKLERGDVVIEVGGSHLDATVATRWQRAIASLGQDLPWIDVPEK